MVNLSRFIGPAILLVPLAFARPMPHDHENSAPALATDSSASASATASSEPSTSQSSSIPTQVTPILTAQGSEAPQSTIQASGESASSPEPTQHGESSAVSKGAAATHTVIVAPSQGVLRYVPFALNASAGDTVLFRWGANNHTVTKSSVQMLCNQTSDAPFTSGIQNKGFEFEQVINNTDPTWFFCNFPGHCQRGMFGAINPKASFGAAESVASVATTMAAQNPSLAALLLEVGKSTEGQPNAANWGGELDMKSVPEDARVFFIENVMYTRSFVAANPDALNDDGSVDLSKVSMTTMKLPQAVTLNATTASPAPSGATSSGLAVTPSSSVGGDSSASGSGSYAAHEATSGGIYALNTPRVLVAAIGIFATYLAM